MQLNNNTILITGGASGIGLGLTERFIREGNTVIVCARREAVLDKAQQQFPGLITYRCDLDIATERIALFEWIKTGHPDLNVLVNNAGVQKWINVTDDSFFETAEAEISTNVEAPVHLCHLFSKLDKLDTIMNVTSGLAFVPFTKVPVYSATKAFFHSFTLSLRYLLKAKGIEVIEIIPPALNTDLGGPGLHDAAPPVKDFIESIFEQLKEGKTELTFGFSDQMTKADPAALKAAFERLNP